MSFLYLQAVYDVLSHTYHLLALENKQYKKSKNSRPKSFSRQFSKLHSSMKKLKVRIKDIEKTVFGNLEKHYGKKIHKPKFSLKIPKNTMQLHYVLYWKITLEYLQDKFSWLAEKKESSLRLDSE